MLFFFLAHLMPSLGVDHLSSIHKLSYIWHLLYYHSINFNQTLPIGSLCGPLVIFVSGSSSNLQMWPLLQTIDIYTFGISLDSLLNQFLINLARRSLFGFFEKCQTDSLTFVYDHIYLKMKYRLLTLHWTLNEWNIW